MTGRTEGDKLTEATDTLQPLFEVDCTRECALKWEDRRET
jgi:hypothetical protein